MSELSALQKIAKELTSSVLNNVNSNITLDNEGAKKAVSFYYAVYDELLTINKEKNPKQTAPSVKRDVLKSTKEHDEW